MASTSRKIKYDVFLSFRGIDTRNTFTSHLCEALRDKQIETFMDDKLNRGDEISPSLLSAIEESHISIVVFSKSYASSRWCLDELVKIVECRENGKQIVIPVFHEIDPKDVRNQTGSYAEAFAQHEQLLTESLDKVQRVRTWKGALKQAADLSGLDSRVIKPESVLIKNIVNDVLKKLDKMPPSYNTNLPGMNSRIKQIESLLKRGDVRRIGIWGIGGIGKTTLAREVSNKISCQFESSGFAESVRKHAKQGTLDSLRKSLLSTLLKDENAYTSTRIEERLGRKKLLIILDDVTHLRQIEDLIGNLECLAPRSLIIVTSRDKQVLKNCGVHRIYKLEELCFNDALKLFCQHSFRQNRPEVDYKELSNSVVEKVGGVPLALKVLGSTLFGKTKKVWGSALEKLENIFDKEIHKVLKISYDELDDNEQSIFLDIACFFKGWDIDFVKWIMDVCGFYGGVGISNLIDKSLITKSENMLTMHDLLQAMGKEIVRQESTKDPGKRTRLWHHRDIYDVLTKNTPLHNLKSMDLRGSQHLISCPNFSTAPNLESLMLGGCTSLSEISSSIQDLNKLRRLHLEQWESLESIPDCTRLKSLISLDLLGCSKIKMLPQLPTTLRSIALHGCTSLVEVPSFTRFRKLKFLRLTGFDLASIPDLRGLKSLESLQIWGNSQLKMLPELPNNITLLTLGDVPIEELPPSSEDLDRLWSLSINNCSMLKSLPSSVRKWKSLRHFHLIYCSKIDKLPDDIGTLASLEYFMAVGTAIGEVQSSISCLLLGLENLSELVLSDCGITKLPDSLGNLTSLERLVLDRNNFGSIPGSIINLSKLRSLDISYCERLRELPQLPAIWIKAQNCNSLKRLSYFAFENDIFEQPSVLLADFINCYNLDPDALDDVVKEKCLKIQGQAALVKKHIPPFECGGWLPASIIYPENKIPKWFDYQSRGSFIDVKLPLLSPNCNFLCFALCVVVAIIPNPDRQCNHPDFGCSYLEVTYDCNVKSKDGNRRVESNLFGFPHSISGPDYMKSSHVIIGFGYYFFRDFCDNEFSFQFNVEKDRYDKDHCKVEMCGVHLMSGLHLETSNESEERDEPHLEESDEEDESDIEESYEEDGSDLEESDDENESDLKESDEDEPY
ncbi:hypothetical protein Ddye_013886 [Dipteronia dyeriana]|uniref:ADP-ribosyl cyclase/cyclic ADP-ribose hydrolase n=1 Tax=Dipteronia dyeriana TaxID=168575 RepID=A0AAD9X721_9ROSI|nr:hypothetical protein Ddye_013886 [Dipteronia dyeriana]